MGRTCKDMAGLFPLMDLSSFPVSFDAQPGGEVLFSVWSVRPKLTVAKEYWLSVRNTLWVITVIRTDECRYQTEQAHGPRADGQPASRW